MEEIIEIERKVKLQVPRIPNFIRTIDDEPISIKDIPVKDLEALADLWKKELIKKAQCL